MSADTAKYQYVVFVNDNRTLTRPAWHKQWQKVQTYLN